MKKFVNDRKGNVQVLIQNPADLQPDVGNKFLVELLALRSWAGGKD